MLGGMRFWTQLHLAINPRSRLQFNFSVVSVKFKKHMCTQTMLELSSGCIVLMSVLKKYVPVTFNQAKDGDANPLSAQTQVSRLVTKIH